MNAFGPELARRCATCWPVVGLAAALLAWPVAAEQHARIMLTAEGKSTVRSELDDALAMRCVSLNEHLVLREWDPPNAIDGCISEADVFGFGTGSALRALLRRDLEANRKRQRPLMSSLHERFGPDAVLDLVAARLAARQAELRWPGKISIDVINRSKAALAQDAIGAGSEALIVLFIDSGISWRLDQLRATAVIKVHGTLETRARDAWVIFNADSGQLPALEPPPDPARVAELAAYYEPKLAATRSKDTIRKLKGDWERKLRQAGQDARRLSPERYDQLYGERLLEDEARIVQALLDEVATKVADRFVQDLSSPVLASH